MNPYTHTGEHLRAIRIWLATFIIGLVLSGITAFPLESELHWFLGLLQTNTFKPFAESIHLLPWVDRVYTAEAVTNRQYPFLAYGTDWLAFAHLIIAIAFIGPYRDPIRNRWLFDFGLIACAGVIPLALIAGPIRGIPFPWRLIDCSFGVFGCIPLLLCKKHLRALEEAQIATTSPKLS
ncbi:hypothetical protein ACFPT7_22590 [Acidicapsa dinghuensis]|uniref:DUF2834 domain-containing protein n=1 Tax=Acidicapsa dinghuensis TaxID=2218256 RepID=A0ABW1EMU8_9BACT|nr:hypothetical protein [Acidicapsa dinghuensis]